nr:hypothetical protein [Thermotoga sp. RQ2]
MGNIQNRTSKAFSGLFLGEDSRKKIPKLEAESERHSGV